MFTKASQIETTKRCGVPFMEDGEHSAVAYVRTAIGSIGVRYVCETHPASVTFYPPIRFNEEMAPAFLLAVCEQDDERYRDYEIDLCDGEVSYRIDLERDTPSMLDAAIEQGVSFLEESHPVLMGILKEGYGAGKILSEIIEEGIEGDDGGDEEVIFRLSDMFKGPMRS